MDSTTNAYAARLAEYSTVSTELALLSDRRLGDLLDEFRRSARGSAATTSYWPSGAPGSS
ncbi:hypothetical protein [Amycolatopsis sp.]|uniref:hypothetical protein n=1 Tax=Amycolatopsis sp. TaxID=37632 RepID=UPI00261413CC|nr:hypothetical protein [Amycolatopsis sp.]